MKLKVWLVFTVLLFAFTAPALSEADNNAIDTNDEMERGVPWTEFDFISPEHVQMMLHGIRRIDPKKADRLEKLYQTDFDTFKKDTIKFMKGHRNELFPNWENEDRQHGKRHGGRMWQEQIEEMKKRNDAYLDWLKENYPAEANELEKARAEDPGFYMRKLMKSTRKYGAIAMASKTNPPLAEVLKKDIELKDQRDEILRKLETAQADDKDELVAQLRDVVAARFDVIIQRQQLQHQELLERLKNLEKRVREGEKEVEQWEASKDKEVDARVNELLKNKEEFKWD